MSDIWILAGNREVAAIYARRRDLGAGDWLAVDFQTIRGRSIGIETQLVYLHGFDDRRDAGEIELHLEVLKALSMHKPSILDLRHLVEDELLRNRFALEQWLAS